MNKIITPDRKPECVWPGYDLHRAIVFATQAHSGQKRKGTELDYISHPMEVLQILTQLNAPLHVQIAGVLHDTIEDCEGITMDIIREVFGEQIAILVGAHSEDKSKSWRQRKEEAIETAANAAYEEKLLIIADKVANLRSMAADYELYGEELWDRFNASREEIAWYYSGIQDAMDSLAEDEKTRQLYWEMVSLYKELFVYFFLDKQAECLYQTNMKDCYCLKKTKLSWDLVKTPDFEDQRYEYLFQEDAEVLEEKWRNENEEATV